MRNLIVRGSSALWLAVAFIIVAHGWAAFARASAVVALHPLSTPHDFEAPAPALAAVESAIAERLAGAGFTVVPSAESGAAWERLMREVGGFYDPITGDTVAVKYRTVGDGTVRELAARPGATLWLRPSLEVVVAQWKGGKASWDGASEGVSPIGKGRVPALTLVVAVEDTSGTIVATGRGGIQVLSKVKGSRFVDVPVEKLLADDKRVVKAAGLALEPLVGDKP
jgi:hypothetical protein